MVLFVMVTELSGVQFCLKSYARFKRVRFLNHKYDFRPKWHDTKFNYHFITTILKLQNSVSTNIYLI